MFKPIVFTDDAKGAIRVNENAFFYLVQDGSIVRAKYDDGRVRPKDHRIESDLVDSSGDTTMTGIASVSNVLIELSGAGDLDGKDIALNAMKIRTYYPYGAVTKILVEQTSLKPREILVTESVDAIDTLIAAKITGFVTP